jgi:hypothetical protein
VELQPPMKSQAAKLGVAVIQRVHVIPAPCVRGIRGSVTHACKLARIGKGNLQERTAGHNRSTGGVHKFLE